MASTPNRASKPARLTAPRLKLIQDFKIVSGTNPAKYGQLGSPKWAKELHKFLNDKRISREDVRHWIDTKSEVAAPLPEMQKPELKTREPPEQLWSITGRPLRTCRHHEVHAVQRQPKESRISNVSSATESSQSCPQTQGRITTLKKQQLVITPQQGLVSSEGVLLKDKKVTRCSDKEDIQRCMEMNSKHVDAITASEASGVQGSSFASSPDSGWHTANTSGLTIFTSTPKPFSSAENWNNNCTRFSSSSVHLEHTPPTHSTDSEDLNLSPENSQSTSTHYIPHFRTPITIESNLREAAIFTSTPESFNSVRNRNCHAIFSPSPIHLEELSSEFGSVNGSAQNALPKSRCRLFVWFLLAGFFIIVMIHYCIQTYQAY